MTLFLMENDNYYTHIGIAKCIQNPTCGPCQKCCALGLKYIIQFYVGITFFDQKIEGGFCDPYGGIEEEKSSVGLRSLMQVS